MNGTVIVITGALGALGSKVAEMALARGARVAGVDHAQAQLPATDNRIEISLTPRRPRRRSMLLRRISAGLTR
jgi:nucleoside-diphosphate-sugar epimerase